MKRSVTILVLLCSLIGVSGQDGYFLRLNIDRILIDTGDYKNYYKYDLGDNFLYLGRYENNLKLMILDKQSKRVVYNRIDTLSDAIILKPKFFTDKKKSVLILMVEVAAEYSWGQEVILIKDQQPKLIGYIDCLTDLDNGTSIADHCRFQFLKEKILMTFDDVPIKCEPEESKKIKGGDLKFELDMNGIKIID